MCHLAGAILIVTKEIAGLWNIVNLSYLDKVATVLKVEW
jgi:hypothetical protein